MTIKNLAFFLLLTILSGSLLHSQTPKSPAPAPAAAVSALKTPPKIYVLPITDEIQESMVYFVRRGVKEAMAQKADVLILHMNTPGGKGSAMMDIMQIVQKFEPREGTYTLVDKEAMSAGAFISASTRHIYMTPGSAIGAASPVTMGDGGVQELPPKFVSAYAGFIRAAAEQNGHIPEVFEAMVNKQKGLVLDGKEVLAKGDILTLTTTEALVAYGKPPKSILSAGTVASLDALIEKLGGTPAAAIHLQPSGLEQLSTIIVLISPFLLSAAMLLGYMEFKTPGFGAFGIAAIVCALIYFFGHYVAGLTGYESGLIFLLGVILIGVELFFPGFLVPGVLGLALVLFSLVGATIDYYPQDGFLPSGAAWETALGKFGLSLAITVGGMLVLARVLPKTTLYQSLVLQSTNTPLPTELAISALVGIRGRSITPLRPSGTAEFDGAPIDVVTQGDFIDSNQVVEVILVEGARVVVMAVSQASSA